MHYELYVKLINPSPVRKTQHTSHLAQNMHIIHRDAEYVDLEDKSSFQYTVRHNLIHCNLL